MKFNDLIDLSVGSLWRIKLRATLTITGVVIAIATFVAMLSFAAGNQRWVSDAYTEMGLLTRINVTPKAKSPADSVEAAVLDRRALETLSKIPGVRMAYPYVEFDVTAATPDTQVTTEVRAISLDVMKVKPFSTIMGGAVFSSEDAREAVVTPAFLKKIGVKDEARIVGQKIVISTRVASIDSALSGVVGDPQLELADLYAKVDLDSVRHRGYRERMIQREIGERMGRFVNGLLHHQMTVADTLTVIGVGKKIDEYQIPISPIIVPEGIARRFSSSGIGVSSDPASLLSALQNGTIFTPGGADESRGFSRVTLETDPTVLHAAITDSVEALGFKAFSFAEEFKQIQKFFIYYYFGLGVIGLIALATAALGIANTMIMSITERRREIGILKSLGADEREIQLVFLIESGTIGAVGALVGIFIGWAGTRILAAVVKIFMARQEMPLFDPFSYPVWLLFLALGFGIAVSMAAGLYPASRAARVDPVEALRGE
jgi:ABC-type antimicrobial peptide transport system permease subunit